jgi:hypothetical protein
MHTDALTYATVDFFFAGSHQAQRNDAEERLVPSLRFAADPFVWI